MRISKGSKRRAERKIEAAKTTGWNAYSIHDRGRVEETVIRWVTIPLDRTLGGVLKVPVGLALARADRKYRHFRGGTSTYCPHQGAQECARRVANGL